MIRFVFCLLLLVSWLRPSAFCQSSPAPRPAAATPAATSYESYRLVRTRHIFDPDRRPAVSGQPTPTPAPIRQSDYVALTGTLLNGGKALAFFSGSRAEFNKVLAVRDTIANATITRIDAAGVEVEHAGKKIAVAVGQTVPLDGSAPAAAPAPQPVISAAAGTASASVNDTPAPGDGDAMTAKQQEIMKRMMEKRKQDGLQ